MLTRFVQEKDIPAWMALSREYDVYVDGGLDAWYEGFGEYITAKIQQYEAVLVQDYRSGDVLGAAAFSRKSNKITFFAVHHGADFGRVAEGLLTVALRQLDTNLDITINLPDSRAPQIMAAGAELERRGFEMTDETERENGTWVRKFLRRATSEHRGGSFHYRYDEYAQACLEENCDCCRDLPMPDGLVDIARLEYAYAVAEYPGQGQLFGKMHVLLRPHYIHFDEIPQRIMNGFMREVQLVSGALRRVTGAVKINYEIHSNTVPHLHCHLFPRYLDDAFPSAPIDYRICEPAPYSGRAEYMWFVNRMREELGIEIARD